MSKLSEILPTEPQRLMDLVEAAGVDVSAWGNFRRGKSKAASNPKYCYEWSFVHPKKVVVLNLWHELMEEKGGGIIMRRINIREFGSKRSGPEKRRSIVMDEAIQTAIKDKLQVRVVVLGGKRRDINNPTEKASHVSKRLLDPVPWAVTAYDWKTGQCTLTRGVDTIIYSRVENQSAVDDLSDVPEGNQFPDRAKIIAQVIKRDNHVRSFVIKRAKGKCEYCKVQGFPTSNGGFYLEAHHIISLGDSGRDTVDNVIALCPQHHRQAH